MSSSEAKASGCPVDHSHFSSGVQGSSSSACPVPHDQRAASIWAQSTSPQAHPPSQVAATPSVPFTLTSHDSDAIADYKGSDSTAVGDHFPQPSNTLSPGQKYALSTAAVASSIPKAQPAAGEAGTWVFPSPQRFYDAMKRKGWDPKEQDMPFVVSIHNTVNEQTWSRVLEYEQLHKSTCPNPKLLKFRGRPSDLSLKARFRTMIGYVPPFDRHDWIVDRCGTQVRYVIDFYKGPSMPMSPVPAIHLDVRPALSFGGLWDRARLWAKKNVLGEDEKMPSVREVAEAGNEAKTKSK